MRRQSKKKPKILLYIILLVIGSYLFITYGLRLFVDFAFVITQDRGKTSSSKTTESPVKIITEPVIDNLPNATNEAIILISGRANPDTEVRLFQNNIRVGTNTTDFDGNFQFEGILDPYTNEFYIQSYDEYTGKKRESRLYQVAFLEISPILEISKPEENQKVYESEISIEGTTDKEVFIQINKMPVVVRADGSFSYPYSLKSGENTILIVAKDVAGNQTEKEIKVIYVE